MSNNNKKRTKVASSKKIKATKVNTPKVSLFSWEEFIPMIMVLVVFILLIVGLFTQMFTYENNMELGVVVSVDPITYFIKGLKEQLSQAQQGLETYLVIGRVALVGVPWLLAVIPTFIIFGFLIYKVIRYVFYHDLVEFKYKRLTRWMFAFVLPYIMFVGLMQTGAFWHLVQKGESVGLESITVYKLGYGPIIAFVALCILFVTKIYATRKDFIENKIRYIFNNIPYLLFIGMALTSTFVMMKASTNLYDGDIKYRVFSVFTFIPIFMSQNEININMAVVLISFIIAPIFVPFVVRGKHYSTKIVFSSLLNVFAYGTLFHGMLITKRIDKLIVGYSVYCLVVFSTLLLVVSITSAILKKVKVIE